MVKRNVLGRLRHIMWRSDLEATRLALAFGSLIWAALLFYPGELFTESRTTYRLMAQIANEDAWGAAFLIQGVVMVYSLLWGYKSRVTYIADALPGCILWTSSTAACFISHYVYSQTYQPPAAMSYEVVAAAASWWCLVRYKFPKESK